MAIARDAASMMYDRVAVDGYASFEVIRTENLSETPLVSSRMKEKRGKHCRVSRFCVLSRAKLGLGTWSHNCWKEIS